VGTKDRIIGTAAELFRRHGYTGTGLKQISRDSGATFGSLYHFFPGGKEQLTAETLRWSGHGYQLLVESVFDNAPDLLTGIHDCFHGAAEVLAATDYADACPIETVALEVASTNEALRLVTAEIFEDWIASAMVRIEAAGLPPDEARALGISLIAALEGAFVLSRAMKSKEPLHAAGQAVVDAAQAALARHVPPTPSRRLRRARAASKGDARR
jgi:AcrR family transcriptional regulator